MVTLGAAQLMTGGDVWRAWSSVSNTTIDNPDDRRAPANSQQQSRARSGQLFYVTTFTLVVVT